MKNSFLIILSTLVHMAHAQVILDLAPGDTVKYVPVSKKASWIYVRSADANLALSLAVDGKKQNEQDDSRGSESVERLQFKPEKGRKYELSVYAKAYLGNAKPAKIEIFESPELIPSKSNFTTDQFREDLRVFRSIREQANSGLYVYRSRARIDSIYARADAEISNCQHIFDFYKIIARLTEFEGSCHNYTDLPDHASYYLTGQDEYLPVTLKNWNGHLLQNSKDVAIPLAAEILSINGLSAGEMIRRLSGYYSSDGYAQTYKEVAGFEKGMSDKFYIEFGTHPAYTIRYKWDNKIQEVTLPGISLQRFRELHDSRHSAAKAVPQERYDLKKVNDSMYHLSIRGFDFAGGKDDPAYKKFADFLDNMLLTLERENIENLIIDLRGNAGGAGALYEKVFTYLTRHPFRDSQYAYTLMNEMPLKDRLVITPLFLSNGATDGYGLDIYLKDLYPVGVQGKFYWADQKNPLILPNEKSFKGQLYLFVDEYVASAGSHLASLIKSYTNAIVIGKETDGGYYEHNGHLPVVYELPNTKIQSGFSIVHVIQDARILPDQAKGRGIIPHIEIEHTIDGFLNHTDEYLKKTLELQAVSKD